MPRPLAQISLAIALALVVGAGVLLWHWGLG